MAALSFETRSRSASISRPISPGLCIRPSLSGPHNETRFTGTTALHFAALNGTKGVEELLGMEADPTITDDAGVPPDFWASAAMNASDADLLLEAAGDGAVTTLPDGTTRSEWAAEGWKRIKAIREAIAEERKKKEDDKDGKDKPQSSVFGSGRLGFFQPGRWTATSCWDSYQDDKRACNSTYQRDMSKCRSNLRRDAVASVFEVGGSALVGGGGLGLAWGILSASSYLIYSSVDCADQADRDKRDCLSDAEEELLSVETELSEAALWT